MLLVVLGHCIKGGFYNNAFRGVIFSFHMPFFFVISGFTFRCSETGNQLIVKTGRSARKLFLPAFVCYMLRTLLTDAYGWVASGIQMNPGEIIERSLHSMFWVVDMNNSLSIGMVYFCVVLFFTRLLYDGIHISVKNHYLICFFLGILGVCITKACILPFALDMSLAMLPFFCFGNWMQDNEMERKVTKRNVVLALLLWAGLYVLIALLTGTYFELAWRRYPIPPLSFLCALSGSCFVIEISKWLSPYRFINILGWIGERSMAFFLIHYFDSLWSALYTWTDWWPIQFIFRLTIDLFLLVFVDQIKKVVLDIVAKK